ncbi:MAG: ABC transporter substrate-binding protein [Phycisphaerae bacterium]
MKPSTKVRVCVWALLPLLFGPGTDAQPPGGKLVLNSMQRRGKQIYLRGEGGSDAPVHALLGDPPMQVSAKMLPCVNCHGYSGRGIPEGGVTPSNVAWSALTKSYGTVHATGRRHGPYDENTLKRAISKGIDPAGNTLGVGMPKFQMGDEDFEALIAYLKCIEYDRDPGVSPSAVTIATVLPTDGAMAPIGREVEAILRAYVEDINANDGIYHRRIELRVIPAASSPEKTIDRLGAALDADETFALVAPLVPRGESQLAALADRRGIPVIASLGASPDDMIGPSRYLFYLSPGPSVQARALAEYGFQKLQNAESPKAAIITKAGKPYEALSDAIASQCRKRGMKLQVIAPYAADSFAPELLAWQQVGSDGLFFVGPDADAVPLLEKIAANGHPPEVLLMGSLLSGPIFKAPRVFEGKISAVFPNSLSAQSQEALQEYDTFLKNHGLSGRRSAPRLAAYCAARVMVEALKKSGRELRREHLMRELEGFWDYETGLSPPLTFGPNRRVGAFGAYPVSIDLEAQSFNSALPWIDLEQ